MPVVGVVLVVGSSPGIDHLHNCTVVVVAVVGIAVGAGIGSGIVVAGTGPEHCTLNIDWTS